MLPGFHKSDARLDARLDALLEVSTTIRSFQNSDLAVAYTWENSSIYAINVNIGIYFVILYKKPPTGKSDHVHFPTTIGLSEGCIQATVHRVRNEPGTVWGSARDDRLVQRFRFIGKYIGRRAIQVAFYTKVLTERRGYALHEQMVHSKQNRIRDLFHSFFNGLAPYEYIRKRRTSYVEPIPVGYTLYRSLQHDLQSRGFFAQGSGVRDALRKDPECSAGRTVTTGERTTNSRENDLDMARYWIGANWG